MTNRDVLLKEIDELPPSYLGEVVDFVVYLKQKKLKNAGSMERAAELANDEYQTNKELTVFSALDGEAFYEPR
jgi:hypothetical protein